MPASIATVIAAIMVVHVGWVASGVLRFMISIGIVASIPIRFAAAVRVKADVCVPYQPLSMLPVIPNTTEVIVRMIPVMVVCVAGC